MIWLEKLLASDLSEAYLGCGCVLNFGYVVSTDPISPEDPARDLVVALDLSGPDGPLVGADVIRTLRFPLLPIDAVYPAMGGITDKGYAVARGDSLELPPFNGDDTAALPSGPQAPRLYADPTILQAGAQILRRESGGAATEVVATYRGLFMGWKKLDGTKIPPGSPDPLSIQAFHVKGADSLFPGQFNFGGDGSLRDVIGLCRNNNGTQRRITIEPDRIAQTGVVKVHGTQDGIPVHATRITEDSERWETMSLAYDARVAQEHGMWYVEAGACSTLVAPHEALTTFILFSMPSWPQG